MKLFFLTAAAVVAIAGPALGQAQSNRRHYITEALAATTQSQRQMSMVQMMHSGVMQGHGMQAGSPSRRQRVTRQRWRRYFAPKSAGYAQPRPGCRRDAGVAQ